MPVSAQPPGGSDSVGPLLRYFDVVVIVVAAPIMLLIGVPALGYAVGAGAWILLRAIGVGVDHVAETSPDMSRAVGSAPRLHAGAPVRAGAGGDPGP